MSQVNVAIPSCRAEFFVGSVLLCIGNSYACRAREGNGEGTSAQLLACNIEVAVKALD